MSTNGNGHDGLDPERIIPMPRLREQEESAAGNGEDGVTEPLVPGIRATGHDGPGVGADAQPATGGMKQILADARNWKELLGTKYGLKPMFVIMGIIALQALDNTAFQMAGPDIVRDLDIELTTVFGIMAMVSTVAIFGNLVIGWWGDRHQRSPLMSIGALVSGLSAMATAGVTNAFTLGAVRTADNVSYNASQVPSFSLLADYYPPELRGKIFAALGFAIRGVALFAPLIVGGAVVVFGWRTTFVLMGAPMVVLGLIAIFVLKEPIRGYWERKAFGVTEEVAEREDEPQSFGEAWRTVWAVRTLRRLFMSDIVSSGGSAVFGIFLPFFLADMYGLNAFERGLVSIPALIVGMAGTYLGGGMIDTLVRRNPGRVLTLAGAFAFVGAFGLFGIAFTPPLAVLVTFTSIFGFGFALIGPALGAIYTQVMPPTVRTQGLQMLNLASIPGYIIVIPVAGVLQAEYGYWAAFFFGAPLMILGGAIAMSAGGFFQLDRRNAFAAALAGEEWRKTVAEGRAKLLVCRGVDVAYDGVQVLFGVDFDVEEGEIIALLGTNGAGKSTLLRAISGTQEASSGAVVFDGRDVTHMPPHEIARRRVIHMPGGRGVFPGLSVRENLLLGAWMLPDEEKEVRLADVYAIFPILKERAGAQAASLSGGEQQQLSLAQAFLGNPRLLMIDELSLGLSPAVVAELLEKVREIHARGATIIIVEQSVNVALTIAERAIFMEKGEVKFFGETKELLQRPDILRAVYVKGTGALTDGPRRAARTQEEQRLIELGQAPVVLEASGITKRYGGVTALDGVSFSLLEGSVLGVIGPNGSGKTTLFDVISGFQKPEEGRVTYLGDDITGLAPEERGRRKLVRRFQDARLFPSLTVYETLLVALDQRLEVRNTLLTAASMPQVRQAERRVRVRADRLIELLELGAYREKFVKELSTGLRRITDLTCTLAAEPKVLLLDEPSSGIAQAEAESLAPLLRRIRHETGCTIMIIEHDMPLLSRVADELLVLNRGSVLMRGTPNEVLNDERVIEAYLGTSEAAVQRSGGIA